MNRLALSIAIIKFFLLLPGTTTAQDFKGDLLMLDTAATQDTQQFDYYHGQYNSKKIIQTHSQSVVAKYNPVSLVLRGSMFVYQHVLSPQLSKSCPYEITCSNFCKLAIHDLGMVKGVLTGADRILRCNRISLLDIKYLTINETNGKIVDFPSKYK